MATRRYTGPACRAEIFLARDRNVDDAVRRAHESCRGPAGPAGGTLPFEQLCAHRRQGVRSPEVQRQIGAAHKYGVQTRDAEMTLTRVLEDLTAG
jgi:hypothetical protein